MTTSATPPRVPAAPAPADPRAAPGIRFEQAGSAVVVTLDRPSRINAIDSAIKAAIANEFPRIARDPQVYAVLLRASPARMFSAGGDVREFRDLAKSSPEKARAECAREYANIWMLDCFSKPTIALIEGAVLGTAAGMVATVTHQVGGAGYRFQMPETLIGFFPDNGVAMALAGMPHHIGTWMGLTGEEIGRADALWLGLLTHCIDAPVFDEITALVADSQPIDQVLDVRHVDPGPPPLKALAPVIERCFGASTVAEIKARLLAEREERAWCDRMLARLAQCSPVALEVTLELVGRAKALDLRQLLQLEYRLASRLVFSHDFQEGVRARVVDKTGDPRWRPSVLSDVSLRQIAELFEPRNEGELMLPTRQEMQAARI